MSQTGIEEIVAELNGFLDTKILVLLVNRSTMPGFYGLSKNAISQLLNGRHNGHTEADRMKEVSVSIKRLEDRNLVYYIRKHPTSGNTRRGNRAKWFPSGSAIAHLAFLDPKLAETISPSLLLHTGGRSSISSSK